MLTLLHREAVVYPEIRVRLPACLGNRIRDESGRPEMHYLLQSSRTQPRQKASDAGLLAED